MLLARRSVNLLLFDDSSISRARVGNLLQSVALSWMRKQL